MNKTKSKSQKDAPKTREKSHANDKPVRAPIVSDENRVSNRNSLEYAIPSNPDLANGQLLPNL